MNIATLKSFSNAGDHEPRQSNGPSDWQEDYAQLTERSRRIAGETEPAE